jgi:Dolichyl-phosphate-mannose-protein mannosyltransferase
MQTSSSNATVRTWGGLPRLAWALIGLTVTLSLIWSHARLMWVDEFLAFYSDGLPTLRDVLHVQLYYPLGLEPPTYHFLTHGFLTVMGHNAIALRMPGLVGFLLFQVSLYVFVNRIAGYRSGLIAMAFPLLTNTVARSVDGRPYGLLMGLFAFSIVCWQGVARSEESARSRIPSLVVLWLAIALCLTTHYFGTLVLIPLWLAEITRAILRRHIDRAMTITLSLGLASGAFVLPFLRGTKIYRQHYYTFIPITPRFVVELYRRTILDDSSPLNHPGQMAFIGFLLLALTIGLLLRSRTGIQHDAEQRDRLSEWVALFAIAMLPLFGCLLDVLATHTLLPRYVLPADFAFAALVGIVLQPVIQRKSVFYPIMGLIVGLALWVNVWNINRDRLEGLQILASCTPSPAVSAVLKSRSSERIYLQNFSEYMVYSYYAPDPAIKSRLTLLTDKEQFRWEHIDNVYWMTENLRHFGPMTIVPYEDFLNLTNPLILFYTQASDGDMWLDKDLITRGRTLNTFGPWMNGYLAEVLPGKTSAVGPQQP